MELKLHDMYSTHIYGHYSFIFKEKVNYKVRIYATENAYIFSLYPNSIQVVPVLIFSS